MSNTDVDYDEIFASPRLVSEEDIEEIEKSLAPPEPQEASDDEPAPEVGNLEEEAAQQDKEPEPEIPEKYRGKSPQELIRMHQEAEKLIGQHGTQKGQLQEKNNELAAIIDQYIQRQTPSTPQQAPQAEPEPESDDESLYFTDPKAAIQRQVDNHPTIQQAKATQVEMFKAQAKAQLLSNHPDYMEVVQTPEFATWVQEVPVRQRLLVEADRDFNIESASSLLDWYKRDAKATNELVNADSKLRVKERQEASVGSAKGSAEEGSKRIYRRSDIMKLMEEDPDTYYEVHAAKVQQAYEEGRVID